MRFANDFHSWLHHSWKLFANRLTRDPKIVIHGNSCIILYIFPSQVSIWEEILLWQNWTDCVPIRLVISLGLWICYGWRPNKVPFFIQTPSCYFSQKIFLSLSPSGPRWQQQRGWHLQDRSLVENIWVLRSFSNKVGYYNYCDIISCVKIIVIWCPLIELQQGKVSINFEL